MWVEQVVSHTLILLVALIAVCGMLLAPRGYFKRGLTNTIVSVGFAKGK